MRISDLCVNYGQNAVYKNFNLQTDDRAITCILGESGCGKTTLLNAVAGLIAYTGQITPVKCSYVFQTPLLVPNLTVVDNLKLTGASAISAVEMLKEVGLEEKIHAYPSTLSGGEAQRVSLCRAFLYPAELMLLDEPFSSLDLKTKLAAMKLFTNLCNKSERGAIFVTHDIDEALYLADRIIVLGSGIILGDMKNEVKGDYGAISALRKDIIELLTK